MTNKKELSKRAEACKGWQWMTGLPTTSGGICIAWTDGGAPIVANIAAWEGGDLFSCSDRTAMPDIDSPLVLGWLLALVAEALRDPNAFLRWSGTQWEVVALYPGDDGRSVFGRADTKAEALVCALEAAPAHSSALSDPSSSATSDPGR